MLILFVALLVQSVVGRSPPGSGGRRAPSISLQLYDLEPCKDEPGNFLVSNFTSVREKNGIYHYNAHVLLKKVLKFISKLEVNVTQCVDAVSFNTCSYLTTLKFTTAVCTLMTADSLPWSTMIKALYPTFRCPMAAGKYEMRNATVNIAAIQKLAGSSIGDLLGKVFIAELSLSNEQYQLFSCFKLKASFIGTRT